MIPVFRNQIVDECCHQDLGEISPNAEPKSASKCHEMLRSTGDFRLALFRNDRIRTIVSMWVSHTNLVTVIFLHCSAW
jgi:hypothetical protein